MQRSRNRLDSVRKATDDGFQHFFTKPVEIQTNHSRPR